MGRLKRKAKKGETPSPQECKKHNTMQSLNQSNGSDTDSESVENWPGNLDIQNKTDRQLLLEVCSKLGNVMSEINYRYIIKLNLFNRPKDNAVLAKCML